MHSTSGETVKEPCSSQSHFEIYINFIPPNQQFTNILKI